MVPTQHQRLTERAPENNRDSYAHAVLCGVWARARQPDEAPDIVTGRRVLSWEGLIQYTSCASGCVLSISAATGVSSPHWIQQDLKTHQVC